MLSHRHIIALALIICATSSAAIMSGIQANANAVFFIAQAPEKKWTQPWKEACEETSITMVDSFYSGISSLTATQAKQKILTLLTAKNKKYGVSNDENADEIVSIIHNFFTWDAHVVSDPTLEHIKTELDEGHPVILPTYGKALHNKYFLNGGPLYHVFVLSGYDDETQEFIAKEPGTQFGDEYRYSYETIMNAMHDYLPNGQTIKGRKVAIFTSPERDPTFDTTDGDADKLTKVQEIEHATNLLSADTDHDGYVDGLEVMTGHSPLSKKN